MFFESRFGCVRRRTQPWIRALASILYYAGLSYRRVSDVLAMLGLKRSYEAVRKWFRKVRYAGLMRSISQPSDEVRPVIAMDETKSKLTKKRQVFVWSAQDVMGRDIVATHVSAGRSILDTHLFLNKTDEACPDNRPLVLVDKGPWYTAPLRWHNLSHQHQRFQDRGTIERWFRIFKRRTKRFDNTFPKPSSLQSLKRWLESFTAIYNMGLS